MPCRARFLISPIRIAKVIAKLIGKPIAKFKTRKKLGFKAYKALKLKLTSSKVVLTNNKLRHGLTNLRIATWQQWTSIFKLMLKYSKINSSNILNR